MTEGSESDRTPDPISLIVSESHSGQRMDRALAEALDIPRSRVASWIMQGRIYIDEEPARRPSQKVREGSRVSISPPEPVEPELIPEPMDLDVLYEDKDLIVIDKAAGLVVHPGPGHSTGTLVHGLLHHCGDLAGVGGVLRPGIVHRLDRGTSGVMVAAKNDLTHNGLSVQFHDHSIERIYNAFVRGAPQTDEGVVDQPIGRHLRDRKKMSTRSRSGRRALTRWRSLEKFPDKATTLLEVRPETGRTHQIRVHLASVGLPIHCDEVYGRARKGRLLGLPSLGRPALHARVLGFTHPRTSELLRFEAPFPPDLQDWLKVLRSEIGEGQR